MENVVKVNAWESLGAVLQHMQRLGIDEPKVHRWDGEMTIGADVEPLGGHELVLQTRTPNDSALRVTVNGWGGISYTASLREGHRAGEDVIGYEEEFNAKVQLALLAYSEAAQAGK